MKNFLLLLFLLFITACHSKVYDLDGLSKTKPSALIFLSTECPVSKRYIPRINQLIKDYPQVNFIGVFSAPETPEELQVFKSTYKVAFPMIHDKDRVLMRQLNATHTPEVFLVNGDKSVLYHGAIDNWYYDLEQITKDPTDHFLKNAIESHLKSQPIFLKDTKPVGCLIEQ